MGINPSNNMQKDDKLPMNYQLPTISKKRKLKLKLWPPKWETTWSSHWAMSLQKSFVIRCKYKRPLVIGRKDKKITGIYIGFNLSCVANCLECIYIYIYIYIYILRERNNRHFNHNSSSLQVVDRIEEVVGLRLAGFC